MRTLDFDAIRQRVGTERCACGKPSETFKANADAVRYFCYACALEDLDAIRSDMRANPGGHRARLVAAMAR